MSSYKKLRKLEEAIELLNDWKKTYNNIFSQNRLIDYYELDSLLSFPDKFNIGISFNFNLLKKYCSYKKDYFIQNEQLNNLNKETEEHNKKIIEEKINDFKVLCGRINNCEMDKQQIEAIVRENKNQLVIAGAGSGKTTTIIGKVKYLIKTKYCDTNEILLLSFTRASANEMKEKVEREINTSIDTFTFHKLGLEIIKNNINVVPNIYKDLEIFIEKNLLELINDDTYLNKLIYFLTIGKYEVKDEFEFSTLEEYEKFLRINPPTTLNGEIVKSYGELEIANFLYKNNIRYEYEKAYKLNTANEKYHQYLPDFYLPDYDIYIEYFGIDKNGNVAPYFEGKNGKNAKETYNDSLLWKRHIHKNNKTIMIETYYYEKKDNTLIEKLKHELIKHNVKMEEKTDKQLWQEITNGQNYIISELSKTFETIINLIKSNNYTISKIKEIIDYSYNKENNLIVIDLVEPIFNRYNDYLRDNNQIDFNDMINLATKYILDGKYKHNYKYVIVDEYQDISKSRYNLLLAMRKSNDYKLFCVGDDWQSIYRFSGSDIGLITNFEKYWGKTHMSKIENTYRFSDELADISGNFIMINPNQIKKNISGKKGNRFPLAIINGYTEKNCIDFLIERLLMLESNSFVYFIGRYQFDANILNCSSEFTLKYDNKSQMINVFLKSRPDLKIKFLTAHKSKGLQADYVVILNNKSKGMGFPSKISDLPIIDLLLEKSDDFPYSEERRLFYVAMTRSKKKTFLLTINNNKSIFISELEKEYDNEFKYERFECPKCGGRLIRKKGKFGYFFGCSNYPTCKYTKN